MKNKTIIQFIFILVVAVLFLGLPSCGTEPQEPETIYAYGPPEKGQDLDSPVIHVPDPVLHKLLCFEAGYGIGDCILTQRGMQDITQLTYDGTGPGSYGKIQDLTGVEHCQNLTRLDLRNNQITDIEPLDYLDKLSEIILDGNPVASHSLD